MFPLVSPDHKGLTSVFITLYLLNVIYVPNCFYDTIFEAHYVIVGNVIVLVSRGQSLRPLSILKNYIKQSSSRSYCCSAVTCKNKISDSEITFN